MSASAALAAAGPAPAAAAFDPVCAADDARPLFGRCTIQGQEVPPAHLGALRDSADALDDSATLAERMREDGYVYLRGVLDTLLVDEARHEVFARLASVGELLEPAELGIFSGRSRRDELVSSRGAFWQSVSEGPALRRLTHGQAMRAVMRQVIGQEARPHDYMFLRAGVRGRATGLHYDYPFFTRAHDQVCTAWMPIGDVPVEQGPVFIVEGSQHFQDLIGPMIGYDVARDTSRKATLAQDALSFAVERGCRLLTADFQRGDLVVFGMYTLHGALENHCDRQRVRLSCDVRWQAQALPVDERYVGANPGGTTGAGYGELAGAKPLTEAWHVR
jgi:hypothetical protein